MQCAERDKSHLPYNGLSTVKYTKNITKLCKIGVIIMDRWPRRHRRRHWRRFPGWIIILPRRWRRRRRRW